jgi:hypothetical protein
MCFNMRCPYQHRFTGECRGPADWNQPDAGCREDERKEIDVEKYTNDHGKECYRGVEESTPMAALEFCLVPDGLKSNIQYALHTNLGSLTVLDRMTGFGWRDTETGFRGLDGKFWLASGGRDVRDSGAVTIGEAIEWVKKHANTCDGA